MAITLLSDFPKQIEIDGKLISSDKYLYESITNIMSTLVVVPVGFDLWLFFDSINEKISLFFRIIQMEEFYILHRV
jgi:hypothetical protein